MQPEMTRAPFQLSHCMQQVMNQGRFPQKGGDLLGKLGNDSYAKAGTSLVSSFISARGQPRVLATSRKAERAR